jgi:cysteine desulfurase
LPTAYLDYAATAPVRPEVRRAMRPFLGESFGNPSSVHKLGAIAHEAVEAARTAVAELLGATPSGIVFTSGGTESINLALIGVAQQQPVPGHLITSSIEHHATLETAQFLKRLGWEVTFLPVDSHGLIDPEEVRRAITSKTVLVSVMHANNEVGTIEPIDEIAAITRERGVLLHVDAIQSVGKIPLSIQDIDLLSLSAHKLGGPKGIGALYARPGVSLVPLIHGGGQESGLRSGTENIAGIVGLGAAAQAVAREGETERHRLIHLRDRLADGIVYTTGGVHLNGPPTNRLPGFVHLTIEGLDGHWLVRELSRVGICAATGSACSSGQTEASHVLTAMGVARETAKGAIRLTLGWATTADDIRLAIQIVPQAVERLRSRVAAGDDLAEEYARDCRTAREHPIAGLLSSALSRLRRSIS